MNAPLVIQHVPVAELPEQWRARLQGASATVTVRIEEEEQADFVLLNEEAGDPLFGMWKDRSEMSDVSAFVRQLRAPRFGSDA